MTLEKYNLGEILGKRYNGYFLDKYTRSVSKDENFYLVESDFYPPYDDRVLKSNVKDIAGGDNFADYSEYFFELYDEEDYWD